MRIFSSAESEVDVDEELGFTRRSHVIHEGGITTQQLTMAPDARRHEVQWSKVIRGNVVCVVVVGDVGVGPAMGHAGRSEAVGMSMVYFAAPQKQPPWRLSGVLGRKAMVGRA